MHAVTFVLSLRQPAQCFVLLEQTRLGVTNTAIPMRDRLRSEHKICGHCAQETGHKRHWSPHCRGCLLLISGKDPEPRPSLEIPRQNLLFNLQVKRLHSLEMGGGGLLDIGMYVISIASWAFGTQARCTAHCRCSLASHAPGPRHA